MVCRAFTFINYHIPIPNDMGVVPQYTTIGFFDGLFTEKLEFNYLKEDLKPLWQYTLRKTAESQGGYSYQNVFGFSMDEWNECRDEEFWTEKTDLEYPLTFVVFLQLESYMAGNRSFKEQCRQFNEKLKEILGKKGKFYTYGTIDKNDFIVAIKSGEYGEAVKAIKQLHAAGVNVVYSYSVFSINSAVLKAINKEDYAGLYNESIDSICFKGIANSYGMENQISLDQKYYEFSRELVKKIYLDEEGDNKIYDILGDDDFRFIARNVSLGKLLEQYRQGGMLNYSEKNFRFYLFSSNMLLNSLTLNDDNTNFSVRISDSFKRESRIKMEREFKPGRCLELEQQMKHITEVVRNSHKENADEKILTFCHALWQLLQSLKALEAAPTKKYDFYSLYHPLSALVRILESKLTDNKLIGEREAIYDFIHKISMTLHGTLRTDIQFFQIKDFNVTVHYAPAKLRAFYSIWVLKLSDYYNSFCNDQHQYSFIFSPGMFPGVVVRQIFTGESEKERLMLITSPERHIYAPKWLTIVLAHEVSHFVGNDLRKRETRHFAWLKITARILELELNSFLYRRYTGKWQEDVKERISRETYIFDRLMPGLGFWEKKIRNRESDQAHCFYSKKSIEIIQSTYRKVQVQGQEQEEYLDKILKDYVSEIENYLVQQETERFPGKEKESIMKQVKLMNAHISEGMILTAKTFFIQVIKDLLGILKYITSEMFADLIAIFTLNLSLEKYILTYIKSEFPANPDNIDLEREDMGSRAPLVTVRIEVLTCVISKIVKNESEWFDTMMPGFADGWRDGILEQLIGELPNHSNERELAFWAELYHENIRDCNVEIEKYKSLYDDIEEAFLHTELDFLLDKKIHDGLCDYLFECSKTYIDKLKDDEGLKERHDGFVSTYNILSGDSPVDLMQEIEGFLASYEEERKNDIK